MLDVGNDTGRFVEAFDQPFHHDHASLRGGHDQAVGPRIGIDPDLRKDTRHNLAILRPHVRKQLEHCTANIPQLLCRLSTTDTSSETSAHTRTGRLTGRIDHALDRQVDRFGEFFSDGVLELEDTQLVDRTGTVEVHFLDQCGHFLQVTRSCLHNDRVGPHIGIHHYASGEPRSILPLLVEIFEHRGHLRRRCVLQPEDLELGRRIHRLIEFHGQIDDRSEITVGSQDQDRVGLDHRDHRHGLASLARLSPGVVECFVDRGQQGGQRFGVDVLEHQGFKTGNSRRFPCLQQFDQLHHLRHVFFVSDHDQSTVGKHLDLHLAFQSTKNRLGRIERLPTCRRRIAPRGYGSLIGRLSFRLRLRLSLGQLEIVPVGLSRRFRL